MFGKNKGNDGAARSVTFVKDPGGTAAVNLDKLDDSHAGLVSLAKGVGMSLNKRGLAGVRGRVIVLLDHSGSMRSDYEPRFGRPPLVQKLLERTLALGLQIDTDGEIEVYAFDSRVWPVKKVNVGNYQRAVNSVFNANRMGLTELDRALKMVLDIAKKTNEQIICVVITDGNPYDGRDEERSKEDAIGVVCELSHYPVWLKFFSLREVPFLRVLDNLEETRPGARLVDNVDTQPIEDPYSMSDDDFADAMAEELDTRVAEATAAGILR